MATPASVYDYDVRTRELTLRKQAPVLGGYDPADYEQHRLWATADDGTQVPISVVHRRGRATTAGRSRSCSTATARTRAAMDPYFSVARLSLLDRGAGFAIAHVRGGGEMGRHWYEDGKLPHKQNTLHRLHRLRPAPGRDRLDHRRTGSSPRAARPAAC